MAYPNDKPCQHIQEVIDTLKDQRVVCRVEGGDCHWMECHNDDCPGRGRQVDASP